MRSDRAACLFDCDGVLIDSFRANYEAYRQALSECISGVAAAQFSPEIFSVLWGQSWRSWLPRFSGARAQEVHQRKTALYGRHLGCHAVVLPGLRWLLRLAKARFPVAVVSNASAQSIAALRQWLSGIGLDWPSDTPVLTPDSRYPSKPAPHLLVAACRRLGVSRGVYIDDDQVGGRTAARAAGLEFIPAKVRCANLDEALFAWMAENGDMLPPSRVAAVGVILAAGRGARLAPVLPIFHKCLARIGGRPVVAFGAEALARSVDEVVVVVNQAAAGALREAVGTVLEPFGVAMRSVIQTSASGVAHALRLAVNAIPEDCPVVVVCGDNVLSAGSVSRSLASVAGGSDDVRLAWTCRHVDPDEARELAVLDRDAEGREFLVEKPRIPPSNVCWCGPIAFSSVHDVRQRVSKLTPSARGELEMTDLANTYLREGQAMAVPLEGPWFDVGTPDSLAKAYETFALADDQS